MREANSLYLQGRYEEAVKKYAQALARHPDVKELYFNLGNAYLKLGDAERAARNYQEYLKWEMDLGEISKVHYNLGNAALSAKDARRAIESYKESLRKDPSNQKAKWNLEMIFRILEQQKDEQGQKGQEGKEDQQQGDEEAESMEALEREILATLDIPDPYAADATQQG